MAHERWSREELYQLVWERPMTSLAKEYHISDVGLRKVCVKYDIPYPTNGYWSKVKAGQKIKCPPLPDKPTGTQILKPEKRPVVQLGLEVITILDEDKKPSFLTALSFEQEPENSIKVMVGEEPKHEIAARTLAALLRPSKKEGIIADLPRKTLDVRVSQATARRAVAIMDTLLNAFDQRSWLFEFQEVSEVRTMYISLLGTKVKFWLEEVLDRIPHVLTPAEEKDKLKNPWRYSRPTSEYIPSGNLALKLDGEHDFLTEQFRATWADSKRQHLDLILNRFCVGLVHAAIARSNGAIKRQAWDKERAEEERRRKEEEHRRLIEEARIENLKSAVISLEKMLRIQRYIGHVRDSAQKAGIPIEGDLAAWLEWAENLVRSYDPLAKGMPRYEVEPSRSSRYGPFTGMLAGKQEDW